MSQSSATLYEKGFGIAVAMTLLSAVVPAQAEVLYTLNTQCSLKGAAPVACTVQAVDEGNATLYRHQIGDKTLTVRISDRPIRMALWDASSKQWQSLKGASARFSSNTICFNGRDLCVVNANYLNSVREDNPTATAQRDLVKVHFGADGRIDASCYDDGCEVSQR